MKRGPRAWWVHYSEEVEGRIARIETALREKYGDMDNMRWHAIKFLEFDEVVI